MSVWTLFWMGSAWAQDVEEEPFIKPMMTLESTSSESDRVADVDLGGEGGSLEPSPEHALRFARNLSYQNLGLLAYPEYLRVADAHPKTHLADLALYEAGLISIEIRSPVEHYRWAAQQVTDAHKPHFLLLSQREIYRESLVGYSSVDVDSFVDIMNMPELSSFKDAQRFMLGSIYMHEDNEEGAIEQFGAIGSEDFQSAATSILSAIEMRDLPKRNKRVAGLLSILVPGTGEMYAGDMQSGVSSLLVTGLGGLGTWYAYQDPNSRWLFTGLAAVGTLTLYIRQIGSGIKAAESFNQQQRDDWLYELMWPNQVTVELNDEGDNLGINVGLDNGDAEVE